MQTDTYSLGYSAPLINFLAQRTAETHAAFFLPRLKPGSRVLDAGCGPGTITLGLARKAAPGQVIGIDVEDSQFTASRREAQREGLNIEFRRASVYELPFENQSFDAVFSHALLEHLTEPAAAIAEFRRVLKPGSVIGLRAGDLGGLLIDADSDGPAQAFSVYMAQQRAGSKDSNVGRKLGRLLRKTGFTVETMTASYEVISDLLAKLGPSLAQQFAVPGSFCEPGSFCKVDVPPGDSSLFVALAWCEATGRVQ
jgi:ubiquinone/menaquinone biosynthesis C-methylase UbiE